MTSSTDFTPCNACCPGCISPRKHTCWRRDTDSDSVEEPPPAKRQRTSDPQTKRRAVAHDGGKQFEMKMAAIIGLRGLHRGNNFELATNVKDAGNFDDLIYTTIGRRYCLQLKYTLNPGTDKLVHSELVPLLHKCFETYKNMADKNVADKVQSEFIIYTNQQLGSRLLNHNTAKADVDKIFKTSDEGKIFKFIPDKDKESDIYTLLEKSLAESKEYPQKESKDFLNKLIIFTGQKDQWELDSLIEEEIRNHDAIKVDRTAYKSILDYFKTSLETWWRNKKRESMTPEMLKNWLQRAKTEYSNPLVRSWFKSCTKGPFRTGLKFSNSEISRLQAELSNKRAVHLRSDALTLCSILMPDCVPKSKCIFVKFDCLQSNKNILLHAWLGGLWKWLVVSCDPTDQQSGISDTCFRISEIIKPYASKKRLLILTEYSVQQVTGFDPIEHKFSFEQLSKESQEMVLDKKVDFQGCEVTMRSVLQRHGNVEHVLGPELVTDLVTEGTAVNIGGKLHVNTGYYAPRILKRKVWLPLNILRNRRTYPDVFAVSGMEEDRLVDIVPSDEKVGNFYFYDDSVNEYSTQNCTFEKGRFIVLRGNNLKSSFLKLCENYSRETLHWLKYKDEKLLWKESRGDIGNLLNCIKFERTGTDNRILRECMRPGCCEVNEDSICDLAERTVLVVAEPGMGKSSTTTQVARHTKERDPTSWVVRINWNDHTGKLKAINTETFNLDTLVEFLCSAAFSDSKYTEINRSLLKQALQSSGNVTVLMDGFDEISPTHADKAAVILSELKKTKVGTLWVTSRPVQTDRLQKELSVIAFSIKKLSYASQKEIFLNLWLSKVNGHKDREYLVRFINKSLLLVSESHRVKNFTGTPLYVKMIVTALEQMFERNLRTGDLNVPEKFSLIYLYDTYFERIIRIQERDQKTEDLTKARVQDDHEDMYLTERQNSDVTNSSFRDDFEYLKQTCLTNFEKCALAAILPPHMMESLHDKKMQEEIQPFLDRVQAGKHKTGRVMNVVDGKPQFVHRTFAEYFAARWFSENFESNRSVLEHILFDSKYSFVAYMFDSLLARDCPLHCAVLENDKKRVETLLKERCDISAVDKGGRTVMHIIAIHNCTFLYIIGSVPPYAVPLDTKDSVLRWTPFQYANKLKDSSLVNWLLKNKVDGSGSDMIKHRAREGSPVAS